MVHQEEGEARFDLAITEADGKFGIHSRMEILFILRAIMQQNELVTVYFNRGRDFILTTIVDISPDGEAMILDLGANEALNAQLLKSERSVCSTTQDRVDVRFVLGRIEKTTHAGLGAFYAKVPEALLRMQRREYYRLHTPRGKPLKCIIPLPAEHPRWNVEATVLNISCGGIAVIDYADEIDLQPGARYRDCRIELPGTGTVVATIEIKNSFDVTLKSGEKFKRSGCEFVAMPEGMQTLIQRYIMKLQREWKARLAG